MSTLVDQLLKTTEIKDLEKSSWIFLSIADTVEDRDSNTGGHIRRVILKREPTLWQRFCIIPMICSLEKLPKMWHITTMKNGMERYILQDFGERRFPWKPESWHWRMCLMHW